MGEKYVNRFEQLFGKPSKWLSTLFWIVIVLSFGQALFPLFYILFTVFFGEKSVASIPYFLEVITDYRHLQSIENSILLALIVSGSLTLFSAIIALIFRWCNLTGNKLIYSLSFFPLLIPDYVFGIAGRVIFDPSTGLFAGSVPSYLLIDRFSSLYLVAFVTVMKWLPLTIVVADLSILAMGSEVIRQVRLDYKSYGRAVRFVYFPQMKEALLAIVSWGFLIGFRQHELAYELTSSGAGFGAETWSNWNYRELFQFSEPSKAGMEALIVLFILLVPILIIRRQAQRIFVDE